MSENSIIMKLKSLFTLSKNKLKEYWRNNTQYCKIIIDKKTNGIYAFKTKIKIENDNKKNNNNNNEINRLNMNSNKK